VFINQVPSGRLFPRRTLCLAVLPVLHGCEVFINQVPSGRLFHVGHFTWLFYLYYMAVRCLSIRCHPVDCFTLLPLSRTLCTCLVERSTTVYDERTSTSFRYVILPSISHARVCPCLKASYHVAVFSYCLASAADRQKSYFRCCTSFLVLTAETLKC